ncbi:MAG: PD-(D/E)XK nuclease family protein [Firmicutes bacterium]|nr:PD-(D/E)XK nuclease family protein [Alicyclobacillaceae bacterium]MCL6498033.1 PD-(D/E)XK nuclease family protein [Bacillota bacterium]
MARRAAAVPAAVAGGCLRYAVMEVLGFGRQIEAAARQAMAEGAMGHRRFQAELATASVLVAAEVAFGGPAVGVRGRVDAVVQWGGEAVAVEFKTVDESGFEGICREGPRYAHVAQLATYLEFGPYPRGILVVEARDSRRRVGFALTQDAVFGQWLRQRVAAALEWAASRRLPPREVSVRCQHCDRWPRCFADTAARDQAVAAHPRWEPAPPVPPLWLQRVPAVAGGALGLAREEGVGDGGGSRISGTDGI